MSGNPMELKGYILPEEKESRVEDEDEEEEQQPEFLDMEEIDNVASGGRRLLRSSLRLQEVDFKDFSEKVYQVQGHFALRSPWWQVKCSVQNRGNRLVMKGFPSYKLRSDLDREGWISIVSLFLRACGVEPEVISHSFFHSLPPNIEISLHNLMEVIDEFSKAGNEDTASMITTRVSRSVDWMQVQTSLLHPHVMKYLPTLLPGQFIDLLGIRKQRPTLPDTQTLQAGLTTQQNDDNQEGEVDVSLLNKLEHIIKNDVWILGFRTLVFRELGLVRCEAPLKAFEECDILQKIPPLQRHALLVYDKIKKHCYSTGSTYVDLTELSKKRFPEKLSSDQVSEAISFLSDERVVDVPEKTKVVLHNFYLYETGIADCLHTLVDRGQWNIPVNATEVLYAAAVKRQQEKKQNGNASPSVQSDTNTTQRPSSASSDQQAGTDSGLSPIKLDQDHVQAAKMICANPVTIISGKAGCGKTTVISELFKAAVLCEQEDIEKACADFENDTGGSLEWDDPTASPSPPQPDKEQPAILSEKEILLTAPTGRAASLLSKKTKFHAYTLHQVLFSFMMRQKDEEERFKEWKFKDVRILIVDEGSMVCVQLLHSVLRLLTERAQLRKFVILGDVRQLPSIQPGNVLQNLFDSLRPIGWTVEMMTNHRAESHLIVKNAGLIAEMGERRQFGHLEFDAKVDIEESGNTLSADKKFILVRLNDNCELQRAVKFLIETAPGLDDDATSQFITFRRNDVKLINELCCKHYNKHTTRNHKNKLAFQPGDKVCCTKNGYLMNIDDTNNRNDLIPVDMANDAQSGKKVKKNDLRLCNGEIFFITEDKKVEERGRSRRYVTLDDRDGREFTVDYRQLQRECKMQHAWARTIHTFQGSENETIVYVVGNNTWPQTWKHIYTAVTRGQKRVYVVTSDKAIESVIQRREIPRNTRLGGLVKEQLVHPWMLTGMQSNTQTTSAGSKRKMTLSAEHAEVPCKQPQVTSTNSSV
uniref:Uncharacterized protein n=1 Tax=Monopterus albus TaxID=43700 RepID=A0A3Q3QT09_MONAL|nr:DNA helicase B [Monopterus albus]